MSTITLVFMSSINHLIKTYQNQLDLLEMQKVIIVALNKFDIKQIKQGVFIDQFQVRMSKQTICVSNWPKRKTIVLRNRIQGFTFIEMIFALLITIVILTSLPLTIKLVSHYKALANENSSIEFEFFHRDLIRDINQNNLKLFVKNKHTFILRNNESGVEYTFKTIKYTNKLTARECYFIKSS